MDDFERRLENELKHLLDAVVATPVPRPRRLVNLQAIPGGLIEQPAELAVVSEPFSIVAPAGTPLS